MVHNTHANNGDGTFAAAAWFRAGDGPQSVCAADLDGDIDPDPAVADYYGDSVAVLINCAVPPCPCPCHADPRCDSITTVHDVVRTVDAAFRGETPVVDPGCPMEQTDANCSGATTVHDVVHMVNIAFRGLFSWPISIDSSTNVRLSCPRD